MQQLLWVLVGSNACTKGCARKGVGEKDRETDKERETEREIEREREEQALCQRRRATTTTACRAVVVAVVVVVGAARVESSVGGCDARCACACA